MNPLCQPRLCGRALNHQLSKQVRSRLSQRRNRFCELAPWFSTITREAHTHAAAELARYGPDDAELARMQFVMRTTEKALGLLGFLASSIVLDATRVVAQGRFATRPLPRALARAAETGIGPVESEMRNVDYRVDELVTLKISYLRGTLRSTRPNEAPWFDDPTSFDIALDSAIVAITPRSLTALLNTYVFNYPGTDIKKLEVSIEGNELVQTGVLDKAITLPFRIRSSISVTPDGRLRLHPTHVKVAGLGVRGIMNFFGIELQNMVKVKGGRGVEVVKDDFLLSPESLLPPPRIKGRVRSVQVANGVVLQTLVGTTSRAVPRMSPPTNVRNYMLYQGRVLRFGKLTMNATDLQIVDGDQKDPFDFFLGKLNDQLVAGASRNLRDYGLVTTMPDYGDLVARNTRTSAGTVVPKKP